MKIHNIEQGTPEWHELRCGKITGTSMKKVLSTTPKKLAYQLIGQTETGYVAEDEYLSPAMIWGREMEPLARMAYQFYIGQEVKEAGFLQPDNIDWFGLSPDGYIETEQGIIGLEIKAPNTERHIEIIHTNKIPTDAQANWRPQVMSWFLLSDRVIAVDFVSFDERFKAKKMHIIRINRNDVLDEIEEMRTKLAKFRSIWLEIHQDVTF